MNVLLKATDRNALADVRLFVGASHRKQQPERSGAVDGAGDAEQHEVGDDMAGAPAPADCDPRIDRLETDIAALRQQLAQAATDRKAGEAEAFERGRLQGDQEALKNADAALHALSTALDGIQQEFSDGWERLEALALHIAQAALARILGDASQFSKMVFEAVRHQLAEIDASLIAGVRISSHDFPDKDNVAEIASRFPRVGVTIDADLAAGECSIDLLMGEADISIGKQWSRLSGLMDEWAREGVQ